MVESGYIMEVLKNNKRLFTGFILLLSMLNHQAYAQTRNEGNTLLSNYSMSGNAEKDTTATPLSFSLRDCIVYATKHQPAINQSGIDEAIAKANKGVAFSGWLPQVNAGMNYQHYFQLPTSFFRANGTLTTINSGVANTSTPQLSVTQNLFSNEALLAAKAAKLSVEAAKESKKAAGIELVANVSRSFYDILLSAKKIEVYKEDTARLRRNKDDAYYRYVSGVADKVDAKQATIAYNNSLAQLKTASEDIESKYALLKQLMGCPTEQKLNVLFDTAQMMQEIYTDTLAPLRWEYRTEYKQLLLAQQIQHQSTQYYQMGFLPSLSAFYTYNYQYQSNNTNDLYNKAYPNSLAGVQLSIPIFTGFKRAHNTNKAKLLETRLDWDEVNLKLAIYTQYRQAMAGYRSNIYYLHTQAENATMAREVYDIVKLQYKEGIKPYIDVIISETQLQTAEINYLNALFQVLESKLSLEKAMGTLN